MDELKAKLSEKVMSLGLENSLLKNQLSELQQKFAASSGDLNHFK